MTDLERIARAICKANNMDPDAQFGRSPRWNVYVVDARAAVEAMMTPSDAVLKAGVNYRLSTTIHGFNKWRDDTRTLLAVMCRAILDEKENG
jgi:hypothetical protein